MAMMYPKKVEKFGNDSEKQAYEILSSLPETYKVIYEPIIGTSKRYTPDFVLLSELNGLVVLDVKYVNLENIERSDSRTIYYKDGRRLKNFNETVRDYTYVVINQLARTLQNNGAIVVNKKVNFSYSFGILLFVKDYENYTKNDIAKILSLDENSFIVCNNKESAKKDIEQFISNLNKPFTKGIANTNHNDILDELYIDCDIDETELTYKLSNYKDRYLKNINNITESNELFEKSNILKNNLLNLSEYSTKSIELMNKNLPYGFDSTIDDLKKLKHTLENEKFKIGVFGYFSSGKSTFLNALLGIDYLPTAEERLTAIFTKIVHVSEDKNLKNGDVKVYYKDFYEIEKLYNECISNLNEILTREEYENFYNKLEKIEDIKDIIKVKLNNIKIRDYSVDLREQIKNAKNILNAILDFDQSLFGSTDNIDINKLKDSVADNKKAIFFNEVKIYLDNDFLKNIELVDTPGYGSTNSLDTDKSHQFVQDANVVIFLTNATTPLQAMEEKIFLEKYISLPKLNESKVNVNNLFIVANKIDTTQKSVDEVKNMIIKAVDDEFEGDFVIDENRIFTLSSKFHLDKNNGELIEKHINVKEDDLHIFKENFLKYLIENKDKEFINKNFTEIENILIIAKNSFESEKEELTRDIDFIDNNIKKFDENNNHIGKKLDMFINSIKSIESKLQNEVTDYLNSLQITVIEGENTKDSAIKAIEKDFKSKYKEPTNESAYKYFDEYIKAKNSDAFNKINNKYNELIKDELEVVNRELDKYTKELELEYKISGLETTFNRENINYNDIKDIDLKKSFLRDIWEFFKRAITDDRYYSYAESIVNSWNNNPIVYLKVKEHLNNNIKSKFMYLDEKFTETKEGLVAKVRNKLNDEKARYEVRLKDQSFFNKKVKKFEEVLKNIDENKEKIKNQIKDVYKE